MVSKPYYRVDLFNRKMTNVLLTSLLVTTIENKTVAHIGTSTGRLLQVWHNLSSLAFVFIYLLLYQPFILCWQLVLTRSSPVIFANYSLVENQRVSSIAAVHSSEYLLFVVGDKVQLQSLCTVYQSYTSPSLADSVGKSCSHYWKTRRSGHITVTKELGNFSSLFVTI